ncbi:MAG: serine--tRNA ligase, partial [Acidimicrobiia bacterium]
MIDVALLREDPDLLRRSLGRRGLEVDVDELVGLEARLRDARSRAEQTRAAQKEAGRRIARLSGAEKEAAIQTAAGLAGDYKRLAAQVQELEEVFLRAWEQVPNLVDGTAAEGLTEEDAQEVRRWGEPPSAWQADPKDHEALGEALGIIDVQRAAKVSGSRFGYLLGKAVLLELGLVRWAFDRLGGEGFVPVVPPVLVREAALYGTGFFPADRDQVYALEGDDLYLV